MKSAADEICAQIHLRQMKSAWQILKKYLPQIYLPGRFICRRRNLPQICRRYLRQISALPTLGWLTEYLTCWGSGAIKIRDKWYE
jgi:hypothetical protein